MVTHRRNEVGGSTSAGAPRLVRDHAGPGYVCSAHGPKGFANDCHVCIYVARTNGTLRIVRDVTTYETK